MWISRSVLLLALSLSTIPAAPAAGAAGALDPSFGTGGRVTTQILPAGGRARALVIQPDGKIVAGGSARGNFRGTDFLLVRYLPNGTPDPGFGSAGMVKAPLSAEIVDLVLQPDGKIVAVGSTTGSVPTSGSFHLARYHPDGSLDTSFGVGGLVRTNFGSIDFPAAAALLPDGRIVVAGSRALGLIQSDFVVAVYESDGSLSADFGNGGWVSTGLQEELPVPFRSTESATAVVVQPDSRIVAVGYTSASGGRLVLVRYEPDGSRDPSFGEDGKVIGPVSGAEQGLAAALQPDGRIVVAGSRAGGMLVQRYLPDGSPDPGFGMDGLATTAVPGQARDVVLQPDGRIVLAGVTGAGASADFALARYTAGGALDTSFGTAGRVTTDFFDLRDEGNAVSLQPDGRIVIAGFATDPQVSFGYFALARYLTNSPPVISGTSVSRPVLWPPNHKMVDVSVFYQVTDDQDPAPRCALRVTSDEPVNGTGDGDTAPDWQVIDAHRVLLRAERAGGGDGRVYSIAITCTDSAGASAGKVVTVSVPLQQGRRP